MKITKRQLRRIIKEEKTKELRERPLHMSGRNQNVMEQLHTAIDALIEKFGNEEARMELQGIVDEWSTGENDQYNEGTSLKQMPDSWRQILGTCLKGKK